MNQIARSSWLLAVLALMSALQANAAPALTATVSKLNQPAWQEINGEQIPLKPGMEIAVQSTVVTGNSGRVVLHLPDGSDLQVGGDTHLRIDTLDKPSAKAPVSESFKLITGVLRFVTTKLAKTKLRDVTVRLSTATIGIRGTDFFAEVDGPEENVCLFEGKVVVKDMDGSGYPLTQARQFFHKDTAQAKPVLSFADEKQIAEWRGKWVFPAKP
ncbi:FecR family protein [Andreprevotia chitinilytica]|uniref:FecR family protein n=1 Tax=Andreprevotia chitinilytica TaxID=396808 RepID=UPI000B218C7B|nr:FecR family protein [Andreprevotia chitinilytica]